MYICDCGRYHSCSGRCSSAGRCGISHHTQLSGLLQICKLLHSIEDQLLEGANSTSTGRLFYIVDRWVINSSSDMHCMWCQLSCYLYLTQHFHLIHIFPPFLFFFKIFLLIHNLELPLSKPKDWEHLTLVKCMSYNAKCCGWFNSHQHGGSVSFLQKKSLVTQDVCLCVCMYVVWYALLCFRCLDMRFSPQVNNNDSPHLIVSEHNIVFMQLKSLIIGKYTVWYTEHKMSQHSSSLSNCSHRSSLDELMEGIFQSPSPIPLENYSVLC